MSLKNQSTIENDNAFMVKVEDLIKEILIQNGMPYYRIESGMEFIAQTEENSYRPVIRVITYFEDTVSKISDILHNEFVLENIHPVDKKNLRVDTFSYKHIQYLAGLKTSRQSLTEYKRSPDKKFEIQICSMLQDAWVGIEKELGYDNIALSDEIKRDFYRVGALLEMADIEFLKIRSKLSKKDESSAETEPVSHIDTSETQHIGEQVSDVAEQPVIELESMDMNVDSFNSLGMNVNTIDQKNGITDESLSGLINLGTNSEKPLAITPEEQHKDAPPVAEIAPEATPAASGNGDGVNLNIDNIQTFNMNVSGMIEKTTEIIRENGATTENKAVPFYNEEPKPPVQAPVDENAQMTDASLRDYVLNSKILKEVDMQIAERAGAKLNPEIDIEGDVDRLRFLKVHTLRHLHEKITDNSADIVAFAEKWIGKDNGGSFDSGICLFYLEYLLVGKKNDPAFAIEYVVKFISDNDYSARYIIPTYNSISNIEPSNSHAHLTLK